MDRSLRHAKNKLVDDGSRDDETGQRQCNDQPEGDYARRPDKTCIWIEYRQHRLSALLDTGSDVSIAGEKLARKLGWTIRAHSTEAVSVANNKTMSILGAVHVALVVTGRSVKSEILIAPDFDGLLLGINWLHSQGRFRWDFDRGRIKFGKQEWIKLREETEQPPWASINRKDFSMAECGIGINGTEILLFKIQPEVLS